MLILQGNTPPINPLIEIVIPKQEIKEEQPVVHIVEAGDTLEKIAKKHDTTWTRLFYKNDRIQHPDMLEIGMKVTIPKPTEELQERLYVITQQRTENTPQTIKNSSNAPSGWYQYGWCTWFIWTQRPVGQWNNASQWLRQAQRDGWSTGSTPQVGAIAWESNHVSLVIAVNGDSVTVRESNYIGFGVISERTAPASQFKYIY